MLENSESSKAYVHGGPNCRVAQFLLDPNNFFQTLTIFCTPGMIFLLELIKSFLHIDNPFLLLNKSFLHLYKSFLHLHNSFLLLNNSCLHLHNFFSTPEQFLSHLDLPFFHQIYSIVPHTLSYQHNSSRLLFSQRPCILHDIYMCRSHGYLCMKLFSSWRSHEHRCLFLTCTHLHLNNIDLLHLSNI